MTVQLELWHLILLLLAFFGMVSAFGKVLLDQVEKRLGERFSAQETAREVAQKHWDTKFSSISAASREESSQWQRIERELLSLKAELPTQYVRREDYIRNQTVIEAKIDRVFGKLELLQLQGEKK